MATSSSESGPRSALHFSDESNLTEAEIGEAIVTSSRNVFDQLSFTRMNIVPTTAKAISDALQTNLKLKHLLFNNCRVDRSAPLLSQGLQKAASLTHLCCTSTNLRPETTGAIFDGIARNTTLLSLTLNDANLQSDGALFLGEALKQHSRLTELNLDGNEIGDAGATFIAEAISQNSNIRSISVANNDLSLYGVRALCEAGEKRGNLSTLNVADNSPLHESGPALLKTIEKCSNIMHINIRGCGIAQESESAILRLVQSRSRGSGSAVSSPQTVHSPASDTQTTNQGDLTQHSIASPMSAISPAVIDQKQTTTPEVFEEEEDENKSPSEDASAALMTFLRSPQSTSELITYVPEMAVNGHVPSLLSASSNKIRKNEDLSTFPRWGEVSGGKVAEVSVVNAQKLLVSQSPVQSIRQSSSSSMRVRFDLPASSSSTTADELVSSSSAKGNTNTANSSKNNEPSETDRVTLLAWTEELRQWEQELFEKEANLVAAASSSSSSSARQQQTQPLSNPKQEPPNTTSATIVDQNAKNELQIWAASLEEREKQQRARLDFLSNEAMNVEKMKRQADEELRSREKKLAERTAELIEHEKQLRIKDVELHTRHESLAKQMASCEADVRQLEEMQRLLRIKEAEISTKLQEGRDFSNSSKEAMNKVREREEAVSAREAQATETEKKIKELSKTAARESKQIRELRSVIKQKETSLAELEASLAAKAELCRDKEEEAKQRIKAASREAKAATEKLAQAQKLTLEANERLELAEKREKDITKQLEKISDKEAKLIEKEEILQRKIEEADKRLDSMGDDAVALQQMELSFQTKERALQQSQMEVESRKSRLEQLENELEEKETSLRNRLLAQRAKEVEFSRHVENVQSELEEKFQVQMQNIQLHLQEQSQIWQENEREAIVKYETLLAEKIELERQCEELASSHQQLQVMVHSLQHQVAISEEKEKEIESILTATNRREEELAVQIVDLSDTLRISTASFQKMLDERNEWLLRCEKLEKTMMEEESKSKLLESLLQNVLQDTKAAEDVHLKAMNRSRELVAEMEQKLMEASNDRDFNAQKCLLLQQEMERVRSDVANEFTRLERLLKEREREVERKDLFLQAELASVSEMQNRLMAQITDTEKQRKQYEEAEVAAMQGERRYVELEATMTKRARDLDQLAEALEKRRQELTTAISLCNSSKDDNEKQEQDLSERQKALDEREKTILLLVNSIGERETALSERERKLESMQNALHKGIHDLENAEWSVLLSEPTNTSINNNEASQPVAVVRRAAAVLWDREQKVRKEREVLNTLLDEVRTFHEEILHKEQLVHSQAAVSSDMQQKQLNAHLEILQQREEKIKLLEETLRGYEERAVANSQQVLVEVQRLAEEEEKLGQLRISLAADGGRLEQKQQQLEAMEELLVHKADELEAKQREADREKETAKKTMMESLMIAHEVMQRVQGIIGDQDRVEDEMKSMRAALENTAKQNAELTLLLQKSKGAADSSSLQRSNGGGSSSRILPEDGLSPFVRKDENVLRSVENFEYRRPSQLEEMSDLSAQIGRSVEKMLHRQQRLQRSWAERGGGDETKKKGETVLSDVGDMLTKLANLELPK